MTSGKDWIAFGLAVYGAVVASWVAASQYLRDRPGVKIKRIPYGLKNGPEGGPSVWGIRIVNHRKRPITIREGGLLGERGQRLRSPIVDPETNDETAAPFPATLTDGTSLQFFVPFDLKRDQVQGGAFAIDDLGHVYETKEPRFSARRHWDERKARRQFESSLAS